MRSALVIFILMVLPCATIAQGKTHHWLLGYTIALWDSNTTSTKARLLIDSNAITVVPESRKMPFGSTQATICDENGNLLIATNGCWIADSTGDTMMNGDSLNPSYITNGGWCNTTSGLGTPHGNALIPMPDDSSKYVLFHQTWDTVVNTYYRSMRLYSTTIDLTLNNGLGAVPFGKKNVLLIYDTLGEGIAACKHANGRDWWIIVSKDSTDIIYQILLTPNGIDTIFKTHLNVPLSTVNQWQPQFSPDGKKFAYGFTLPIPLPWPWFTDIRIFDFDRCSGVFSNPQVVDISDTYPGMGIQFSSNSKYLYCATQQHLNQIDVSTLSTTLVATNDGYYSPYWPFQTDFWAMYRAANGKIYISSGNGVLDMHVINEPDSAGLACDVQLHSLHLPCFQFRANVYHPNYYLGCDTASGCPCLSANGLQEMIIHDFHFSILPNPNKGQFKIIYLLPQNKSGVLDVIDMQGNIIYSQNLPAWSSLQNIKLLNVIQGVYVVRIRSGGFEISKKITIFKSE